MAAYGLYTHIASNKFRSMVLLASLFALVYVMVYAGALGRLIALSEAYPDLKANANFQQLASELSDLENKIAASRRFFNNAVQEYNPGIQQMPAAACSDSPARISSISAQAAPRSRPRRA